MLRISWMVFIRWKRWEHVSADPFSSIEVPLPHQSTISDFNRGHPFEFVLKMVLSASPSENSYFVVAVILRHFTYIAFWRPGDTSWTCPEIDFSYPVNYDVTYDVGHFYSFNNKAQIKMYTFVEGNPLECQIISRLKGYSNLEGYPAFKIDKLLGRRNIYIIKTLNKILLVIRSFTNSGDWYCRKTSKFLVIEFRMSRRTWGQIDDLRNMAIFVGSISATTLVDASRFPGFIKANHIYSPTMVLNLLCMMDTMTFIGAMTLGLTT